MRGRGEGGWGRCAQVPSFASSPRKASRLLIYDRLGARDFSGAIFSVLLHKNQETARGRDPPQIIVCHPGRGTNGPRAEMAARVSTTKRRMRIRMRRRMASAGRQILHIILSAQWTERYRLESSVVGISFEAYIP